MSVIVHCSLSSFRKNKIKLLSPRTMILNPTESFITLAAASSH